MLEHGGTDLGPAVTWDFSTNANPLPQPDALSMALARADRRRYPEPSYLRLRERLAEVGLGDVGRILPTAGSAEAIRRLTLTARLQGVDRVWTPWPGFGEYAAAAQAVGIEVQRYDGIDALAQGVAHGPAGDRPRQLVWVCDPCNPTGRCLSPQEWARLAELCEPARLMLAVDLAYAPLSWPTRQAGEGALPAGVRDVAWQLWSPNKALGLTGVRAGALVAPDLAAQADVERVARLAPSWVLSSEGVALLQAWCEPEVREWLAASARQLADWRDDFATELTALGWTVMGQLTQVGGQAEGSGANPVVPFLLARPPVVDSAAQVMHRCRAAGIRLRDASSLGLPGWLRMRVHLPEARQALLRCLRHGQAERTA